MSNQMYAPGYESLFYPYVHIRDLNWLKSTLLVYEKIHRMLPVNGRHEVRLLKDDPTFIYEYAALDLVRPAHLNSGRVFEAQWKLIEKLRSDAQHEVFKKRFGFDAARKGKSHDDYGFQVRKGKFIEALLPVLCESNLAWRPLQPQPFSDEDQFFEVHPKVGEALMSTLAVACAQEGGLDVVAGSGSESLHECLVTKDANAIYETWLGDEGDLQPPAAVSPVDLFGFMVEFACDLSAVNAVSLLGLGEDRKPVRDLLAALQSKVDAMPKADPGPHRTEYLHDAAAEVLAAWRADRNNLPNFWKAFWGGGATDVGVKFVEKVVDKVGAGLAGAVGGAAAAGGAAVAGGSAAAHVTSLGALATLGAGGAAGGLAIGGLAYGMKTAANQADREKKSNYRLLTAMEAKGVVIRGSTRRGDA